MSTTTTLRNNTESVVVLREGQVGLLRKVCEIPAGGSYRVTSNLTATYKEYWCAVQPSTFNDKFILTSDDCIDWKEIEIRPKASDPSKFEWKGKVLARNCAPPGNPQPAPASPSSAPSTIFSKLRTKLGGFLPKPKSPGRGSPPATTTPAAT